MRPALLLMLTLSSIAGCTPTELMLAPAQRDCEINTLTEVFASPLSADGESFCGNVMALRESETVKFFPAEAPLPADRTDLVALPDRRMFEVLQARLADGQTVQLYIEGVIEIDRECFEDSNRMCLPYRRPIDIRVSEFRVVTDPL